MKHYVVYLFMRYMCMINIIILPYENEGIVYTKVYEYSYTHIHTLTQTYLLLLRSN